MKIEENYKITDKTIRFIFALSLASLLLFFGCDQGSGLTSPLNELPDQQQKLITDITSSDDSGNRNKYLHRRDNIDYPPGADSIFLPLKLPGSEIPNLEVSAVVSGQDGGSLEIHYEFETSEGNTIIIMAQLDIPKNVFNGEKDISMMLNNELTTISFYPHLIFDEPVMFTLEYQGIDVSDINPDSVDFIFQNYDGTIENVVYDKIQIDVPTGKLKINKAELMHFSRYGFVN